MLLASSIALVPVGDEPTSTTRLNSSGREAGAGATAAGATARGISATIGAGAASALGAAFLKSIGAGPSRPGGLDAHAVSPAAAEASKHARNAIGLTSKRLRIFGPQSAPIMLTGS